MEGLSPKEIEILLLLVKDLSKDYNSNNITREIKITPAGAFKALKRLNRKGIVTGKKMGKAVFYKANLKDYYSFRIVETLLIHESRDKAKRWVDEFRDLFDYAEAVILYGSIVKSPRSANDIDLLVIPKDKNENKLNSVIRERKTISSKPIHVIKRSLKEFSDALKREDDVVLSMLKTSYILHGHNKILEVIKNTQKV